MPAPSGYMMHESGFWFRQTDQTGPYVYDGVQMLLVSALITGTSGPARAASSVAGAAQAVAASLSALPGKTNYVTGITITGSGSTLGSVVLATLSGLTVQDLKFAVAAPANLLSPIQPVDVQFDPPIPASAVNVAITLSIPSVGLGNTSLVANIYGYSM